MSIGSLDHALGTGLAFRRGMKRNVVSLLSAIGIAVLAGCFTQASTEDEASSEHAGSEGGFEDSFGSAILSKGCTFAGGRVQGTCPTNLADLLTAAEKNNAPQVFVVSEEIDRPSASTTYRFVIAATANKDPFYLATVGTAPDLDGEGTEAIGFDRSRQAFVYWKVEGSQWVRKGDGAQVSSTTNGTDRPFECIKCHSTGAPLMKELHDSWGNWKSQWFSKIEAPPGASPLFTRLFDKVKTQPTDAAALEKTIIDSIHLHSKGRVDRAKKEGKLRGILAQLMCEIGEPSLVGAHTRTNTRVGRIDTFSTMLPGAIVLNQLFVPPVTGGTGTELGLEQSLRLNVPLAMPFMINGIDPAAYIDAIAKNEQTIGGQLGDTIFPMSSPEKSYADLDAVQELLRQNLIDKEIVADALMTDYTVSAFSKIRCDLAPTIPDTWDSPATLKQKWGANLSSSKLRGAKGLAARLKKDDLAEHASKLDAFVNTCKTRNKADFTRDVVKIVSQRRLEFEIRYGEVIESGSLIPRDRAGTAPGGQRLSSKDCTLEPQSAKFDGEE
jgi:hypothetical protein